MSVATTTTVAALRRALVDQIRAVVDVKVQVAYGQPLGLTERHEAVWLGNTAPATHEPVALTKGRRHRSEAYDTLVTVSVSSKPRHDENEVRAIEIASAIESAIADDYTIGGGVPGLQWLVVREVSVASQLSQTGNISTLVEIVVAAQADLR